MIFYSEKGIEYDGYRFFEKQLLSEGIIAFVFGLFVFSLYV